MGPAAATVVGSLATDAITTGLNLVTGQESRTPGEIAIDMLSNVALSLVFTAGMDNIGKVASKGTFNSPNLKQLGGEIQKTTVGVFFKELGSESFTNSVQSFLSFIIKELPNKILKKLNN